MKLGDIFIDLKHPYPHIYTGLSRQELRVSTPVPAQTPLPDLND